MNSWASVNLPTLCFLCSGDTDRNLFIPFLFPVQVQISLPFSRLRVSVVTRTRFAL